MKQQRPFAAKQNVKVSGAVQHPGAFVLVCCASLVFTTGAFSQSLAIHTLAGRTFPGSTNGWGSNARFNHPNGVATDSAGNVYAADTWNGTVRKITPDGFVTTLAGIAGIFGSANGSGTDAHFYGPQGIAADATGTVYVADTANAVIRTISAKGMVNTLAGAAGSFNSLDGTGLGARFYHPEGVVVDPDGNIYVADTWNHTIRKITPTGAVTTLAGRAGEPGSADGTGNKARFNRPTGIAVDSSTNLFVTDSLNHTIRMIVPSGKVSTIAGLPGVWGNANGSNSAARFFQPQGIVADNGGDLIVADSGNQTLRRISPSAAGWMVTTIAGTPGSAGCADGRGEAAQFVFPSGLALDGAGFLYIADSGNHLIRTTRDVPPTLRFETSEDHLTLFWPSSSSGFVLETRPTLALGESWQAATNAVTDTGDNLVVTISADCAASFYRLRKP